MRILVCGGRDYLDQSRVHRILDKVRRERGIEVLIHGGARGADTAAGDWAKCNAIRCEVYPVEEEDWKRFGPMAGPLRNRTMLFTGKPDAVIAFPGGDGTADMVRAARQVGLKVWQVDQ